MRNIEKCETYRLTTDVTVGSCSAEDCSTLISSPMRGRLGRLHSGVGVAKSVGNVSEAGRVLPITGDAGAIVDFFSPSAVRFAEEDECADLPDSRDLLRLSCDGLQSEVKYEEEKVRTHDFDECLRWWSLRSRCSYFSSRRFVSSRRFLRSSSSSFRFRLAFSS
jgi:hypothetical protein